MNDLNGFTLGDFNSEDHGIIMTAPPPEVFAERDVEIISVVGRSGDIIKDNGRYKNVPIPYSCAILPEDDQTLRRVAIAAVGNLNATSVYQRLEDTYNPEHFRMARISGGVSVDSIVEQAGEFTLIFDCKPQRFLISGEFALPFMESGTLLNPTGFEANPIIKVYGTSAGEVNINGTTVRIDAITDPIILDCEVENAYSEVEGSAAVNQNGNIYAPKFPTLSPGTNTVSFTGGITKLEIIPRWWTL